VLALQVVDDAAEFHAAAPIPLVPDSLPDNEEDWRIHSGH
jgi:hypothetical protein